MKKKIVSLVMAGMMVFGVLAISQESLAVTYKNNYGECVYLASCSQTHVGASTSVSTYKVSHRCHSTVTGKMKYINTAGKTVSKDIGTDTYSDTTVSRASVGADLPKKGKRMKNITSGHSAAAHGSSFTTRTLTTSC